MRKGLSRYFHQVVGLIDRSRIVADRSTLSFSYKTKHSGRVSAPKRRHEETGLVLRDGSTLTFFEELYLEDNGSVAKIAYVYHYERPDGYFFRYEKLAELHPDPIFEPTLHLHVIHNAPRFPTHCTNLDEVLDVIRVNFFR